MTESVLDASRRSMARGSRSFYYAARLLPPAVRASAQLLYAWCRHCDDTIDGQRLGHGNAGANGEPARGGDPRRALAALMSATEAALGDAPVSVAPFAALRRVVRKHDIPTWYVREHLRGFAMDVEGARYETLDDTVSYAFRVAGVVGVMMAWLMGVRDRDTLDRAADLGIAFQLTNIARDVVDDARAGRVYLPETWLREEGLDASRVDRPEDREALARVVARLLDHADRYYRSATVGIDRLHLQLAWSIESAHLIYRDIGTEVRNRGAGAWDRRVVVPTARKLALMTAAAVAVMWPRSVGEALDARRGGLRPIPHPAGGPGGRGARHRGGTA